METYADDPRLTLEQLGLKARDASLWLKILGVGNIIIGVPTALALVGILYIWLGVLLVQAGKAAEVATGPELIEMMDKLRTYFIVNAILMLLGVLVMVLYIAFFIFLVTGGLGDAWMGI